MNYSPADWDINPRNAANADEKSDMIESDEESA
jgi:hypothetical protein